MTSSVGILVHAHHPNSIDWEELVWGVPAQDRLGDLTKVVELLLQEIPQKPITHIVTGSTLTIKEGMLDGEYTKKFLLDHFDKLQDFPRLRTILQGFSASDLTRLRKRLEGIIVTKPLKNTADEIEYSTLIFSKEHIHEVIQVASASHGPRCIQLQAAARAEGKIPQNQQWFVVMSDMCFGASKPKDTLVIETPHRADDPMLDFHPTLPESLQPYFYELSIEDKKKLNTQIKTFMDTHRKSK